MDKLIIAVDPGSASGAIAFSSIPDQWLGVLNMPDTPEKMWMFVNRIWWFANDKIAKASLRPVAYVENVGGSRPGNSAKSARTFAVHQGHLEMAFVAAGIPVVKVAPRVWLKALFGDNYPKGSESKQVTQRKRYVYDAMVKRKKGLEISIRQADAVALLMYAYAQEGGEASDGKAMDAKDQTHRGVSQEGGKGGNDGPAVRQQGAERGVKGKHKDEAAGSGSAEHDSRQQKAEVSSERGA